MNQFIAASDVMVMRQSTNRKFHKKLWDRGFAMPLSKIINVDTINRENDRIEDL